MEKKILKVRIRKRIHHALLNFKAYLIFNCNTHILILNRNKFDTQLNRTQLTCPWIQLDNTDRVLNSNKNLRNQK